MRKWLEGKRKRGRQKEWKVKRKKTSHDCKSIMIMTEGKIWKMNLKNQSCHNQLLLQLHNDTIKMWWHRQDVWMNYGGNTVFFSSLVIMLISSPAWGERSARPLKSCESSFSLTSPTSSVPSRSSTETAQVRHGSQSGSFPWDLGASSFSITPPRPFAPLCISKCGWPSGEVTWDHAFVLWRERFLKKQSLSSHQHILQFHRNCSVFTLTQQINRYCARFT